MQTVRDLLAHYPRRLAERGELTELSSLQVDDEVTVVADVLQPATSAAPSAGPGSRSSSATARPPCRSCSSARQAWRQRELTPGARGLFSGKVGEFRGRRQLVHPEYLLLRGSDGTDDTDAATYAGPAHPGLPGHPGGADLDDLARRRARAADAGRGARPAGRRRPRAPRPDVGRRRDPGHAPPRRPRAVGRGPAPAGLGRGARRPARARPAAPRRRAPTRPAPAGAPGRPARRLRRPAAVRAHRGPARGGGDRRRRAGRRAPDAPAAAGRGRLAARRWWRCGRCCRWSTPAARPRCSPRPRCWPPSTPARIETLLGPLAHGGMLGGADDGTRVALLTGSLPAPARKAALLEAAGGSAGIVVGTHALIQEHVQFADLGLVVVDEQHRFGVEQRDALRGKAADPAARAGHDGDADPAHRRHDRVRRPRDLHAGRAAGRPRADHHLGGARGREAGLARPRLAAHPRGGRGRPAGLRRLPAHRRRAATGRRAPSRAELDDDQPQPGRPPLAVPGRRCRCCAEGPLPGLRVAAAARPAARPRTRTARCSTSPPGASTCWSRPP